jgi:hypothetical protein
VACRHNIRRRAHFWDVSVADRRQERLHHRVRTCRGKARCEASNFGAIRWLHRSRAFEVGPWAALALVIDMSTMSGNRLSPAEGQGRLLPQPDPSVSPGSRRIFFQLSCVCQVDLHANDCDRLHLALVDVGQIPTRKINGGAGFEPTPHSDVRTRDPDSLLICPTESLVDKYVMYYTSHVPNNLSHPILR